MKVYIRNFLAAASVDAVAGRFSRAGRHMGSDLPDILGFRLGMTARKAGASASINLLEQPTNCYSIPGH
jgi:hypothetical protein